MDNLRGKKICIQLTLKWFKKYVYVERIKKLKWQHVKNSESG